ncbi:Uncharacterized protein Fot_01586 [Forsythia ovata]|uniref:Uncharacterized protein n=1 Tax=Forsythia ovata TaxID=205694 RepID=A0ABD1X4V9_9LAMI
MNTLDQWCIREVGDNRNIPYTYGSTIVGSHVSSLDKQLIGLWAVKFSNQRPNKIELRVYYLGYAGDMAKYLQPNSHREFAAILGQIFPSSDGTEIPHSVSPQTYKMHTKAQNIDEGTGDTA